MPAEQVGEGGAIREAGSLTGLVDPPPPSPAVRRGRHLAGLEVVAADKYVVAVCKVLNPWGADKKNDPTHHKKIHKKIFRDAKSAN